ncbi:MAG TPA: hypothetical protein VGF53_10490 [Pseudolabrys sp.]
MMPAIQRNPNADRLRPAAILYAVAFAVVASGALAQGVAKMIPFQAFQKSTAEARFENYAGKDGTKVANADEFQKMKAHVTSMYEGVKVRNSFVLGGSDVIDCVDMKTQPSLRQNGKFTAPAKPPAPMIAKENKGDEARAGRPVAPMLSITKKDAFGNAQYCGPGFVPMRRITLDELVRYQTLGDFFNKYGKAGEKGDPGSQ